MGIRTKRVRSAMMTAALAVPLLAPVWSAPASAQGRDHQQFYNGAARGGRGGNYGYDRDPNRRTEVNGGYYQGGQYHPNGIGPGKGAAIGAAGGAALGAVFGGGLKGALIGGGVGAGIGAIAGKAHQNNQRRDHYQDRY